MSKSEMRSQELRIQELGRNGIRPDEGRELMMRDVGKASCPKTYSY
jgi:hypothetical protein